MAALRLAALCVLLHVTFGKWIIRDRSGTPALEVYYQSSGTLFYTDAGSLIWTDLALWRANDFQNFLQLGHRAQTKHDQVLDEPIPMVRDISAGGRNLFTPLDFSEVWRDEGGFGELDVAFWRLTCPPSYFPVGDVANACDWCGWEKPDQATKSKLACVHQDFVEPCGFEVEAMWTNTGGFENQLGSVWSIRPFIGVRGFWAGAIGHEIPPNGSRAYCLLSPEWVEDTTTTSSTTASTTSSSGPSTQPGSSIDPGSTLSSTVGSGSTLSSTGGSGSTLSSTGGSGSTLSSTGGSGSTVPGSTDGPSSTVRG